MSVSQGIKRLGCTAIKFTVREMMQISYLIVIQGVKIEYLSSEQISRIITSSMSLKEKFTAEGSFEKLKSRLVAGGHLKDRDIYDNGSSPILFTSSLFKLLAIASRAFIASL